MAVPDPTQVAPWYLRNINQALAVAYTAANADLLWKFGWEELSN
jgi:hypothetical protein